MAMAAKPDTNGFNEFGYNYGARLFNGWYGQWADKSAGLPHWSGETLDAYLVMKWSDDWKPQADEPIGAWCTNHWTWYSGDVDEGTWYGWDTRVAWTDKYNPPMVDYKVEEFMKIMKVGDNAEAWEEYEEGGAYSAGWGTYESTVPKYVVFQDTITIYEKTWSIVGDYTWNYAGYIHDLFITLQNPDGTFSGTGGYPADALVYETGEIITGTISGSTITLTTVYTGPLRIPYTLTVNGIIDSDGTVHDAVWFLVEKAYEIYMYHESFDLCTTSPKGLGQPIF